jgi:hypothetical protein
MLVTELPETTRGLDAFGSSGLDLAEARPADVSAAKFASMSDRDATATDILAAKTASVSVGDSLRSHQPTAEIRLGLKKLQCRFIALIYTPTSTINSFVSLSPFSG